MFPLVKNNNCFSTVVEGSAYTINREHPKYEVLYQAVVKGDAKTFLSNYSELEMVKSAVKTMSAKIAGLEITDSGVSFNGKTLHGTLVDRILAFRKEGVPIDGYVKFLKNLQENPSARAVDELYDFLENKNLPITEDGCFLAYKTVDSNFYSKASGTLTLKSGSTKNGRIYNGVGEYIECVRNEVDDDRGNQCSKGLHVGGLEYSGPNGWYHSYGDKVVIVKINPKDAVSVPQDHNAQKLRVCAYTVLQEFKEALVKAAYKVQDTKVVEYSDEEEKWSYEDDGSEYDDENLVNYHAIDVSEMQEEEYYFFTYHGKSRTVYVTDISGGLVKGTLIENPNDLWDDISDTEEFRAFKAKEISGVYVLK